MTLDPVIVTGPARSGTSLVTGCLAACGLQLGETCGPTSANPRGQFENRAVIEGVEKPYLRSIGADPAGQAPLPDPSKLVPDPDRRERVLAIVRRQGVELDRPWGLKDAKSVLDWEVWDAAFPNALWVVTRRALDGVARSCERTRFMKKRSGYEDWVAWAEFHEYRADDLANRVGDRLFRVDTDELAGGNVDALGRETVEALGLEWQPDAITDFVDPGLWDRREG